MKQRRYMGSQLPSPQTFEWIFM